MAMDVIGYDIFGDDMQYVEIELDLGEAAIGGLCNLFSVNFRVGGHDVRVTG